MKQRRVWLLLSAAVLLGGLVWLVLKFDPSPARAATGFVSHTLCSGTFVSGLNPGRVYADTLKPLKGIERAGSALRYEVDAVRREVSTTILGLFESVAIYREGLGCIVLHGDTAAQIAPPVAAEVGRQAATPVLKEIAGPGVIEPAAQNLRAALDRAFAETGQSAYRRTAAIVVVHDGRIVAERYAPGYGAGTPLLGWSVTKSVVNALIGILVQSGRLSTDAPAPVSQWRNPGDPHHAITIDHLLRMTSGLDISETNSEFDGVSRMLFVETDMAGFAERAALKSRPGTKWEYTSGNTLILSGIIRQAVGGHAGEVLAFARRELFEPLGMRDVTLEFDAEGTPLGSTYMYASARDWVRFGMLFLDDGVVGGRRILPEGWVRYSSARTLDSPYAAGFWLGSNRWRARWRIPHDAFFASGFLGQRVMVIPSQKLVIARFGNADGQGYDIDGFGRLVFDVIETLGAARNTGHRAGVTALRAISIGAPVRLD